LAAQNLALSQSAVSTALSELEKQLALKLFERVGKRLVVNAAGKLLYPKAVALLNQVDELGHLFGTAQGHLHIGASTTIGNYILPAMMAAFTEQYRNVKLSLHIYNTEQVAQGLAQLNYDLGFIEGQYTDNDVVSEDWLSDELVLFIAKESRLLAKSQNQLSLSELARLPLILRERGSGTRNTVEAQLLSHLPQVDLIEMGHSEAIKQAVVSDMGVGCLSRYTLSDLLALDKIRLISLPKIRIRRQFRLIYNQQKYQSQVWQLFHDFCRQYITALN
jgi:DNA-binding transcriptional LysR family regulator